MFRMSDSDSEYIFDAALAKNTHTSMVVPSLIRTCDFWKSNVRNELVGDIINQRTVIRVIAISSDFDHIAVRKLLSNINFKKAQGPDGIHGKILKNCTVGLAFPLT